MCVRMACQWVEQKAASRSGTLDPRPPHPHNCTNKARDASDVDRIFDTLEAAF